MPKETLTIEIDHEELHELLSNGRSMVFRLCDLVSDGDPHYEADGVRDGLLDVLEKLEGLLDSAAGLLWMEKPITETPKVEREDHPTPLPKDAR